MKKKISIEGMSCMHCVKHVNEALKTVGTSVDVNLQQKYAIVDTDASNDTLTALIDDAGYDVTKIEEI